LPQEWLQAVTKAQEPDFSFAGRKPGFSGVVPADDDPPDGYQHAEELRSLLRLLKQERLNRGLTLRDVARLSRQAHTAISRLENGEYVNPTLHTVYRYARAVGWRIRLSAEPINDELKHDGSRHKPPRS
jgi:hypothetical protein